MGAYTPNSQVWYPDITDTAKLNTLLAQMASSIEDGVGARLEHQEIAVGLKASVDQGAWTLPITTPDIIPYAVSTGRGDFNNGFTFSGGIATVQTAGMYLVTASLGPAGAINGGGIKVLIYKNSLFIAANEVAMTTSVWVGSTATTVLNLVPGDTVHAKGAITTNGGVISNSAETTHLSVTLVQALPL